MNEWVITRHLILLIPLVALNPDPESDLDPVPIVPIGTKTRIRIHNTGILID
jgi:hypothetical protein